VTDWRLLVAEVEAVASRRGKNVRGLGFGEHDVHNRLKWRKRITGKPSDPCKHE
jgi:hypothetical protein